MKLLISGASGLLGLNLAIYASQQHQVTGVTHRARLQNTPFNTLAADLTQPGVLESILAQAQPDVVIHCAALANLESCQAQPERAFALNARLPEQLAELSVRHGFRLVHISTDAVFDGQRGDYSESDAPNPLSVYARTKWQGEQAVLQANPQAIVARVNFFGWSLSGHRSLAEWFFNNLQAGRPMQGFTDVYFCPLLANDLGQLLLDMLARNLQGLYHVVSPQSLSKYDFGVALADVFGLDADLIQPALVEQAGLKAPRSPRLTLRIDKLVHDLGRTPPRVILALERFYTLYQQGYPQTLRVLSSQQEA